VNGWWIYARALQIEHFVTVVERISCAPSLHFPARYKPVKRPHDRQRIAYYLKQFAGRYGARQHGEDLIF
jgi:hypothetical protein